MYTDIPIIIYILYVLMSKPLVLILLALALTTLSTQKGLTRSQLEQKLTQFNTSPLVSLLLVYDSVVPNSKQIEVMMDKIAEKRKGYFNVIMLDCNTDDKDVIEQFVYCGDKHRKNLPALVFSEPSLNLDPKSDSKAALSSVKPYQGQLDEKSLFNFAVPLMKVYSRQMRNAKDYKKFQQQYKDHPKLIYFTDKESNEKIPPLYRALTANFRNTIVFGHVFSTSQLAKDMNITKFPVFLLNGKEKIEVKANLHEIIQRLQVIEGEPTDIFVQEYQNSGSVQLSADNLQELVYKNPEHILIHVIGQDGTEHPEWTNANKKFFKMFKFFETTSLKQVLGVKQTPAIVYFPKSLAKKSVQKTIFNARDTIDDIQTELDSMIEDFTVPVSNFMEMQKMTSIHLQEQKICAIYFHTKQIPLSYKLISNDPRYQDDIAFFRMKDPEKQVIEQYQIKKLPSLILMIIDNEAPKPAQSEKEKKEGRVGMNLKLASYQGKYNYGQLQNFFNTFTRSKEEPKTEHYENQNNEHKIEQITKSAKLKKKCELGCYLLLINGNPENADKNKNYVGTFEREASKMPAGSFGIVDGSCHNQFISAFEVQEDQLPVLVYVDPKFQKFARMIGRVEPNSISGFFSKVRSRKAPYRGYNKLEFENKDCQFEHEKLKKQSESGSAISKQEAEIIQELKAEQSKKRQELQQSKGQKIRKKSKKRRPKVQQPEEQL